MRRSRTRATTTIAVALLLVACASTPSPSPGQVTTALPSGPPSSSAAPSTMLTPAPTFPPASSASASGWPYAVGDEEPVFGPDGTVYFLARDARGAYQRIVIALDAAGHIKPGWALEAPQGSEFGSLAVGPDGSVYFEERGSLAVGSVLHRLDVTGRDLPGWPFEIPADFACPTGEPYDTDDPRTPAVDDPCYPPSLDVGANGTAYLTSQSVVGFQLIAIDTSGDVKPGWPVTLDDQDWSDLQLDSDGSVFLIRRPIGTPTGDPVPGVVDDELWVIDPNGEPRSGWPVPIPDTPAYLVGPRGTVVGWSLVDDVGELCPDPRRTVFTVLGPDGRPLSGWPRGSTGFASFPVVAADGTLHYVSATDKVYAHDRAGNVKVGWPVAVPGAGNGCGPESPYLASDGTIYVVGDEVTALSPDGESRPGWPYRPEGQLIGPCFDSECFGEHGAPAFGPDGTVYLTVYHTGSSGVRAEVVALDREGRPKPGWPYRLPFDTNTVSVGALTTSPDGRLFVRGGDLLLALDPDGRISD